MKGDDRVRFCSQCSLNVYNLSSMKPEEAESLVQQHEGRLCVRFYRRRDGTVLTGDCPVGLRAARHGKLRRLLLIEGLAAVFTLVAGCAAIASGVAVRVLRNTGLDEVQPFKVVCEWLEPARGTYVMGAMSMLPSQPRKSGR
jgi:hypothetical protein